MIKGPSPFRFENMWLKSVGFKEIIKVWWGYIQERGSSSYILVNKLKRLKVVLKVWNREVFGEITTKKLEALEKVKERDRRAENAPLLEREMIAKAEAKVEFRKWANYEEISWRQKSREIWLNERDRNTSFFHRMANAHRRWNLITKMQFGEEWITNDMELKERIVDSFKTLLHEPGDWRPLPANMTLKRLDEESAKGLEEPFVISEVYNALVEFGGDKAPGPNEFTMAFWAFNWETVKNES